MRTRRSDDADSDTAHAYAASFKPDSSGRTSFDDTFKAHSAIRKREANSFQDGMIEIVKRSNEVEKGVLSFVRHLDAGTWYIGMFNDGEQPEDVQLSMDEEGES